MSDITSLIAADGRSMSAVQPAAATVTGSPFSVTTTVAVEIGPLSRAFIISSTEDLHIRFGTESSVTAATSNNMRLYKRLSYVFPVNSAQRISVISNSINAIVYVELVAAE